MTFHSQSNSQSAERGRETESEGDRPQESTEKQLSTAYYSFLLGLRAAPRRRLCNRIASQVTFSMLLYSRAEFIALGLGENANVNGGASREDKNNGAISRGNYCLFSYYVRPDFRERTRARAWARARARRCRFHDEIACQPACPALNLRLAEKC